MILPRSTLSPAHLRIGHVVATSRRYGTLMRLRAPLSLLLVLTGLAWFLSPVSGLAAEPLTVTLAYESTALPPFYLGEGVEIPEQPGVTVELLKAVDNALAEVRFEFQRKPWKRCLVELGGGHVDAIFPGSFKPERAELGIYPYIPGTRSTNPPGIPDRGKNLVTLAYHLYARTGSLVAYDGRKITGLAGSAIGAPLGYSIVEDLEAEGYEMEPFGTTRQNLVKLAMDRITAVAVQPHIADVLIQAEPEIFGSIRRIDPALRSKANYLIFSHQFHEAHPELARLIWETVEQLKPMLEFSIAAKYREAE